MEIVSLAKFEHDTDIHFTRKHTGKMEGKHSLSTSVIQNPICRKRMLNGDSVCAHCYANRMLSGIYKKGEQRFAKNYTNLQKPLQEVPKLPKGWKNFRFESFGDIASETQFHNYCLIARANPDVPMAIWTKNPEIMKPVIESEGKPKNLIIIQSSSKLGEQESPRYPWIDKVFTVYTDREEAKEKGVEINCEAKATHKKCLDCNKCYNLKDKTVYINEILK